MTAIVEVDSYAVIANYMPRFDRIEISKYLRGFPELYTFCLRHEADHALNWASKTAMNTIIPDMRLDLIDRFKIYSDRTLCRQLTQYLKLTRMKTKKERLVAVVYGLTTPWIQIVAQVISVPFQTKNFINKRRNKK